MAGVTPDMKKWASAATITLAFVLIGLALGLYETRALALRGALIDDYWISLIYSRNLAEGFGPVYNSGWLPRAEGYTSFLWMTIMAVPYLVHVDGAVAAKWASLLFGTLALGATGLLAFQYAKPFAFAPRLLAAGTAMFLLAAFQSFELNANFGMESTFAAFLALALLLSVSRFSESPTPARAVGAGVLALLLGLTRPEANLLNAIVLLGTLASVQNEVRKRFAGAVVGSYLVPGALYFAWRVWYYGLLFPLPFYVKQGYLGDGITGTGYVGQFFAEMPFLFFLISAAGLALSWRRSLVSALAALAAIVSFAHSCPLNGVLWRYFVPYYPVLFSLFGVGVLTPLRLRACQIARPGLAALASVGMASLIFTDCAELLSGFPALTFQQAQVARSLRENHVRFGRFLASARGLQPHLTIACGDAGAIEYYGRWRFIDENRLNDPHLARLTRGDRNYVAAFHPDLIVVQSTRPDAFIPQECVRCQSAYYQLAVDSHMTHLATMRCDKSNNFLIYGYPNTPIAKSLRTYGLSAGFCTTF